MRGSKKRYGAVGLLVTGLLTLGMGFGLDSTAGATGNEDCPAGTVQVAKFEWKGGGFALEGGNTGGVIIGAGSNATNGSGGPL